MRQCSAHRAATTWSSARTRSSKGSSVSYDKSMVDMGRFNTAEDFYALYNHIQRAEKIRETDFHLFKSGIRPAWEDAANKHGGWGS